MATRGKTPRAFKWMLAGLLLGALGVLPAPAYAAWTNIFPGVDYSQWTDSTPNRITAVRVNLCAPGVQLRATKSSERRQTPSAFGQAVGAEVAINADFFLYEDYSTRGLAIGDGARWPGSVDPPDREFIAFGQGRVMLSKGGEHITEYGWMNDAVGGWLTVLDNNHVQTWSNSHCTTRHPRTIVGLSEDERTLYMVVVDGRSSSSVGMTCAEQGTLMKGLGAWNSISLDGGGSSAMWVRGKGVANRPSDGSQRVVANHLAVLADGTGAPEACNDISTDFGTSLADVDDFYTQGASDGVADVLIGDEFEFNLLLENTAATVFRGVQVDYALRAPYFSPLDYAIYSDHPVYDQATWELNSADTNPANPPKNQLGAAGTLEMDAFSPRESKRVKIRLRADRYSVGASPRADLRGWVHNIDFFYGEQSAWDQAPTEHNEMGALLQALEKIDVLSPWEWQFNGGEGQFEGWSSCGPADGVLKSNADATAMLAEGADAPHCAQSPDWTSVDTTTYDQMVIRLRTEGAGGAFGVAWKDDSAEFESARKVQFSPTLGADIQTYVLDLGARDTWQGVVTGLQLDWSPQAFERVEVDAIFFQDSAGQKTSSATEAFVGQTPVEFGEAPDDVEPADAGPRRDAGHVADVDSNDEDAASADDGDARGVSSTAISGGCGCSAGAGAGGRGGALPGGLAGLIALGAGVWMKRRRRA